MIKREELVLSKEFWMAKFQITLFNEVQNFLKTNNISQTEFANKLNVSKGYISQILNGDFDHKLSKLIELSLAIDKIPQLNLEDKSGFLQKEKKLSPKLLNINTENKRNLPFNRSEEIFLHIHTNSKFESQNYKFKG